MHDFTEGVDALPSDLEWLRQLLKALDSVSPSTFSQMGVVGLLDDQSRAALWRDFRANPLKHVTTWVPGTGDHHIALYRWAASRCLPLGLRPKINGHHYLFPYLVVLDGDMRVDNVVEIDMAAKKVLCHGVTNNPEWPPGPEHRLTIGVVTTFWRPFDRVAYETWMPSNLHNTLPADFRPWPDPVITNGEPDIDKIEPMTSTERATIAKTTAEVAVLADKQLRGRPDMQAFALAIAAGHAVGRIIGADATLVGDAFYNAARNAANERKKRIMQ